MTWGYVPDHRSILRGREEAARRRISLLLRHDTPVPAPRRYWDISFERPPSAARRAIWKPNCCTICRQAVESADGGGCAAGGVPVGRGGQFHRGGLMAQAGRGQGARPARSASMSRRRTRPPMPSRSPGCSAPSTPRAPFPPTSSTRSTRLRACSTNPSPMLPRCRHGGCASWRAKVGDRGAFGRWRGRGVRRIPPAGVPRARGTGARASCPPVCGAACSGRWARHCPRLDWAPRPLRAKSTLQSLAGSGRGGLCAGALAWCRRKQRLGLYGADICGADLAAIAAERPADRADGRCAGSLRPRCRAICRSQLLDARRHPHQDRPHQHGGEP